MRVLFQSLMVAVLSASCVGFVDGDPAALDDTQIEQGLGATAVFDAALKVPRCAGAVSGCSSGTLLNGRAALGPEKNSPNTLGGTCRDGASGSYHSDESLDAMSLTVVDGSPFAAGKQVRIDATVWAYSSFASDKLDLYYAASAGAPAWVHLATLTPTRAGASVLSATFTLSGSPGTQAVRAQFRYGGSASSCTAGSYNEADDLAFDVGFPSGADAGTVADAGTADAGTTPDAGVSSSLVNPGFESGLSGWTTSGSGVAVVAGGRTGSFALSLPSLTTNSSVVRQRVQTQGPGTLVVKAWFKNPSITAPLSQGLTLQAEDVLLTGPGLKYIECSMMPSSSWVQASCDVSRFAGKLVSFNLYTANAALVDDVTLTFTPAMPNPIVNPGFESGITSWNTGERVPNNVSWTSADFHSGTRAGYFSTTGNGSSVYQMVSGVPAGAHALTFWLRESPFPAPSTGVVGTVKASLGQGGPWDALGSCTFTNPAAAWTKVSCPFTLATTGTVSVLLTASDATSDLNSWRDYEIDDVAIE